MNHSFFFAVVVFEFSEDDHAASERDGFILVLVTHSPATAIPIDLTITPTEYDPSFGINIPPSDPNSPIIATCM